jgi:hypothetical protein
VSAYRVAILADQPLVYWRMGISGMASIVPDETGGGNDLVLQGSGHTLGHAGAIKDDDDTAIRFDGTQSYARASDARALDFAGGDAFTLECWAMREPLDGGSYFPHLLGNMESTTNRNGYILYTVPRPGGGESARTVFEYNAPDSGQLGASGPLATEMKWTHYVAVHEGVHVHLYMDGTLVETKTILGIVRKRTSPFLIGRAPNTNNGFWPGPIDEVAIYGKALTIAQILNHRDIGKSN